MLETVSFGSFLALVEAIFVVVDVLVLRVQNADKGAKKIDGSFSTDLQLWI